MSHVTGVDDGIGYGVYGRTTRAGATLGVWGVSDFYIGVNGFSNGGLGVYGESNSGYGVGGYSHSGNGGAYGISVNSIGVYGRSDSDVGVHGYSINSVGMYGQSNYIVGVLGYSDSGGGVYGRSFSSTGVTGFSDNGTGIAAYSTNSYAAYLDGKVFIRGPLQKPAGQFKIDHPLDPANKYLSHSFVESPDMKNVYDGIVVLDDKGKAEIELPDWFGALNKDFRYQLTAIGAPGPNLYIAEEISEAATTTSNYGSKSSIKNNNSRFKIAGGTLGMKVSWQVTGIRKDPWANAHRIEVEEDKPDKERGYYLHPELYSQPEENGISHLLFPKDKREELARAFHK